MACGFRAEDGTACARGIRQSPFLGDWGEVALLGIALGPDRVPGPFRIDLPPDPGQRPDLDLLVGLNGEESPALRFENSVCPGLKPVENAASLLVSVSIDAERG